MSDALRESCLEIARQARGAAQAMAAVSPLAKIKFLLMLADELKRVGPLILAANQRDVDAAPSFGLTNAQCDRLHLTPEGIAALAATVREIAALPEPIGRVLASTIRPNGLRVDKVAVPLGVLFFLYESRPNVTVDAAALAVKSGNAIILRGGKEAHHSNAALYQVLANVLRQSGLPSHAVQLVSTTDRAAVTHLLGMSDLIDLAIPRGGPALIEHVARHAAMPVMKHFRGVCHVYVDQSADLTMATSIIVNAKCQRPGVCNAAECLLVHERVANEFLPSVGQVLAKRNVEMRGCAKTCALVPGCRLASDADYATEYLNYILNIKVVESMDAALQHIGQFGSGHTEAIVTRDFAAATRFTAVVDAAAVMVNASTRFHDGGEFGLGAEIGISTDKFHARGPCGLTELTSYKYVVYGDGHVRE